VIGCPDCSVPGHDQIWGNGKCSDCHGDGYKGGVRAFADALADADQTCTTCKGSGECQTCGGTGYIDED
jgi:DnaJ-class molecular chaperone